MESVCKLSETGFFLSGWSIWESAKLLDCQSFALVCGCVVVSHVPPFVSPCTHHRSFELFPVWGHYNPYLGPSGVRKEWKKSYGCPCHPLGSLIVWLSLRLLGAFWRCCGSCLCDCETVCCGAEDRKKRKNWLISLISRVSGDPFPLWSVFCQHSHSIRILGGKMPVRKNAELPSGSVELHILALSPKSHAIFSCLNLLGAAPCIRSRFYSFLQWEREVQWACLLLTWK